MKLLWYTADAKPVVLIIVVSTRVDTATVQVQIVSVVAIACRTRPVEAAWTAIVGGQAIEAAGIDKVIREGTEVFRALGRSIISH